ncbi:MAG: hypothetical protein U0237_15335 [Thermoleophilia bacterium]
MRGSSAPPVAGDAEDGTGGMLPHRRGGYQRAPAAAARHRFGGRPPYR